MKKGSTNSVRTTRNEHSHKDFWLMAFSQTSQNEVNQMAMALIIQTLVIFHSEKKMASHKTIQTSNNNTGSWLHRVSITLDCFSA